LFQKFSLNFVTPSVHEIEHATIPSQYTWWLSGEAIWGLTEVFLCVFNKVNTDSMPQYLIHPKHPLRIFVYIVLVLGFVVGGFFTFKASQMSTESRSKAALEYKTYVNWEFNGTDPEGWVGENLTNIKVGGGVLKGIVGGAKTYPKLTHKKVALDQGNKMFEISIAVAPAVKPERGPTPAVEPYKLNVIYAVSTDGLKRKQLVMKGRPNGKLNNLKAKFPEIGKLNIDNLQLEFVNVKSDSIITIESIKVTDIVGTKPSPTPTPLPGLVNCESLYKEKSSYFKGCSDNGYAQVCFNQFTTEYQGCNKAGENTCTQNNVNAASNILCDSSPM